VGGRDVLSFGSGGGICHGKGGEVIWSCLVLSWFCPDMLERVRSVDTPCWR
jgi:hypothetical protein